MPSRAPDAATASGKSIEGDDVLAWALYKNGRCGEALRTRSARFGSGHATP